MDQQGTQRNRVRAALVSIDRNGHETGSIATGDGWRDVALSSDNSHVAVQRLVADANDIWTIDLVRNVPSRFTLSPDLDDDPVWSPDGNTIAFSSVRDETPGLYVQAVSGGADAQLAFTVTRPFIQPTGRGMANSCGSR